MYNQSYINDFTLNDYQSYLSNYNKLNSIKSEYLKQYGDDSNAVMLAFKESLDHYVLKKVLSDDSYMDSSEFKNYLNYLMHIVEEKTSVVNGKTYNLELVSNVVFRNDIVRTKILEKFYSEADRNMINHSFNDTRKPVNEILQKMVTRKVVTQEEIDFVGDYIYSSRNFNNDIGKIYAEYIYNEITPESNIHASIKMLGALTSYFSQNYTIDEDVKNARMFVTDRDYDSRDIAHKSGSRNYCYFNKRLANKMKLTSAESLNKSRTFKHNDSYFLMMLSFHELTHVHQTYETKKNPGSSSAMASVVKNVLNKYSPEYKRINEEGDLVDLNEYSVNHDSSEYEMQADEESWRQCKSFIAKHIRQYAYKHRLDSNKAMLFEKKCVKNEKEISARRAFSLKEEENGNKLYYVLYDIRNLCKQVKDNPSIVHEYPILRSYMDDNGNLDTSVLFNANVTSSDSTGLDVNNSSLQFATYMFDFGKDKILEKINSGTLSENQISNLMMNIYNIMHSNVLKIRDFDKADKSNYDNTVHKYDLEAKSDDVYNYFFKKNANEVYNAVEILYKIHSSYPQLDMSRYNDTKYYVSNFYELLSKTKNIDDNALRDICQKYDSSQAPILMGLSNTIKENVLGLSNQNVSQDSAVKH